MKYWYNYSNSISEKIETKELKTDRNGKVFISNLKYITNIVAEINNPEIKINKYWEINQTSL